MVIDSKIRVSRSEENFFWSERGASALNKFWESIRKSVDFAIMILYRLMYGPEHEEEWKNKWASFSNIF